MFKTNFSKQDGATAFGNNFNLGLYQDSRSMYVLLYEAPHIWLVSS